MLKGAVNLRVPYLCDKQNGYGYLCNEYAVYFIDGVMCCQDCADAAFSMTDSPCHPSPAFTFTVFISVCLAAVAALAGAIK